MAEQEPLGYVVLAPFPTEGNSAIVAYFFTTRESAEHYRNRDMPWFQVAAVVRTDSGGVR